jgi:hypothetical protein
MWVNPTTNLSTCGGRARDSALPIAEGACQATQRGGAVRGLPAGRGLPGAPAHLGALLGAQAHQRRHLAGGGVALNLVEVGAEEDDGGGDAHQARQRHNHLVEDSLGGQGAGGEGGAVRWEGCSPEGL